ncbi:MAG TPA: CapA family protein [Longimicrobiales bacterium]|nr:CapA family protein [Longimicrobiales bacterium]
MRRIDRTAPRLRERARRRRRHVHCVTALALSLLPALPADATATQLPPAAGLEPGDGILTMALTGDAIITRRLSPYREPDFLEMVELVRGADVAFTNLEVLLHDYEPYPMTSSGGTYMRADPEMARELTWAGIDLVSLANNHTGDYGVEGLRLTLEHVEAAGLVGAGAGESLWEAREARFLETADGRVALISVASTFTDHSVAGNARGGIRARPGLSPLRHRRWEVLTRPRLEALREGLLGAGMDVPGSGDGFSALGRRFEVGDAPGRRTEPDPDDLAALEAVVRSADALADYTIVTIHAHESDGETSVPAGFIETFARAMIDAGADVMVGHGPHVLRGIELYRGKPILYSLGDFVFQNETLLRLPDENYARYGLGPDAHVADFNDERYEGETRGFPTNREIWESVVAVPIWEDGALRELRLHPLTLGFGEPPAARGRPMFARGELARKILTDLVERSAPYGTRIRIVDGVGVVRPGAT